MTRLLIRSRSICDTSLASASICTGFRSVATDFWAIPISSGARVSMSSWRTRLRTLTMTFCWRPARLKSLVPCRERAYSAPAHRHHLRAWPEVDALVPIVVRRVLVVLDGPVDVDDHATDGIDHLLESR